MAKIAGSLWDATGRLLADVIRADDAKAQPAGIEVPIDKKNYEALDAAYLATRDAFIKAAAEELG